MTAPERARAYLEKLPFAVAGQGGHAATFSAACRLVEFGLSSEEAIAALSDWNLTHCQPPWSDGDLKHKIQDAFRRAAPKAHFAGINNPRKNPPRCHYMPSNNIVRPIIPTMRAGTAAELSALATLRQLSRDGIALASEKGLLRFGDFRGHGAWWIVDPSGRVAQARRLDGVPWADGVKAWTAAGSQAAWPVGIGEAASFPAVALVEGGPDILAVCSFILAEGMAENWAPVAMLGGNAKIHAEALPRFSGKRVRIFPHADSTGESATNRWAEQLIDAGADVDAFNLAGLRRIDGAPVKDLCDVAAIHPDDFETHRCLWNLFS